MIFWAGIPSGLKNEFFQFSWKLKCLIWSRLFIFFRIFTLDPILIKDGGWIIILFSNFHAVKQLKDCWFFHKYNAYSLRYLISDRFKMVFSTESWEKSDRLFPAEKKRVNYFLKGGRIEVLCVKSADLIYIQAKFYSMQVCREMMECAVSHCGKFHQFHHKIYDPFLIFIEKSRYKKVIKYCMISFFAAFNGQISICPQVQREPKINSIFEINQTKDVANMATKTFHCAEGSTLPKNAMDSELNPPIQPSIKNLCGHI